MSDWCKSQKDGLAGRTSLWFLSWIGAICAVTWLAYAPALDDGFVNLDDYAYIAYLQNLSLGHIVQVFVSGFEGYHPLTILSLAICRRFAGMNPWLYHFVNVGLHLINTGLVFWFVYLLSRSHWTAIVAAILFGVHPVHVEAVAWIASRKDVQYASFYLLGLIMYLKYLRSGGGIRYIGTLFFFVLAAFSKGMAVAFPLSMGVIDFWERRPLFSRRSLIEKVPFILLSIMFGIVSVLTQKSSGYIPDATGIQPLGVRAVYALCAVGSYVKSIVLPCELSAFHPYPASVAECVGRGYVAVGLPLLAGSAIIMLVFRRSREVLFA
jgi:hypothetical protein